MGVLLHQMLTGRQPFVGANLPMLFQAVLTEPLPELPEEIPAPLAAILRRTLSKSPADRYADAAEMAAALRAAQA